MLRTCLIAAIACLTGGPALASSSDWYDTDGASVRLVTTGKPDAAGHLSGMLDIVLKPGWKTYWQDPGDAGVPPQIDVGASTNVSAAEFSFPAPERHDDGDNIWAGYSMPVALPVTFTVPSPNQPATIDASIFLGVCETICVPVQVRLALDPSSDADNADDAATVQAALDALPGPEQPDFGVTILSSDAETLVVQAAFPGDAATVDLFVAGIDGYLVGAPKKTEQNGAVTFTIAIFDKPSEKPAGAGLPYTLVTGAGAVSGRLPYP